MSTETNSILHLTGNDFEQEVLRSDRPVLVDFWADWCQPCHMLAPVIDELAEAYGDRITVAKVDIDADRDLAVTYGINSIPTVLLFKDGEAAARLVGIRPREDYTRELDALLE